MQNVVYVDEKWGYIKQGNMSAFCAPETTLYCSKQALFTESNVSLRSCASAFQCQ